MSIATTAELIVRIIGEDLLTPAVSGAEASLSSIGVTSGVAAAGASKAETALGLVGKAATGMGNALSHAKNFLSGLLTGPLGLIGLGAAGFGAVDFFKHAIDSVTELGVNVEKLQAITGLAVGPASALLDVFSKYGIAADGATKALAMLDKNAFTVTETAKKATAFQKEFGVSLVDNQGHLKDTNTLLGIAADYFNSNASSTEKAAFESKLFGRSWQSMIEILKLGSAGLAAAEQQAAALGLTLSATNEDDLLKFHASLQDLQQDAASLTLALGIDLLPVLTDLAQSADTFVSQNGPAIRQFFKDFVSGLEGFGRFVGGTLIPAIQAIGNVAKTAWSAIPGPLQTLLIEALVGNKVIKTVFGINILGSVEAAATGAVGGILKNAFSSLFGKTIATPVVNVDAAVANVGGAGIPGGGVGTAAEDAGGAAASAGGLSASGLAAAFSVAAVPLIASQVVLALNSPAQIAATSLASRQATAAARGIPGQVPGTYNGPSSYSPGLPTVQPWDPSQVSMTVNALSGIKEDTAANIVIGDALLKVQEQQAAHEKAKEAIGSGKDFHEFLLLFRSGGAKVAISDFPKELAYLSTASDAQKKTAVYASGLRQDIAGLQAAEVNATAAQKVVLSADIVRLQALVAATTAAIKAGITLNEKIQTIKDQGSSVVVTPVPTHAQNTASTKAKKLGAVAV